MTPPNEKAGTEAGSLTKTATQAATEDDNRRGMRAEDARALAQRWASNGIPALPVGLSWNYEKNSIDKEPLSSPIAKHGYKSASVDPQLVEEMFLRTRLGPGQQWGVGVCPGPAGFIVLDVDTKNAGTGLEDLARLTEELGELPNPMRVITASGGLHLWLRRPDKPAHVGNENIAPGIELRCDAGYAVAGGTHSPWGAWTRDPSSPRLAEVGQLPSSWAERIDHRRPDGTREPIAETLTAGSRYPALRRMAGAMRRQGANAEEILAALEVMNRERCDPPHARKVLEVLAADIASRYAPEPDLEVIVSPGMPGDGLVITRASDVTPEAVDWLWEGRIPARSLSLLVGPAGRGKTTLALDLAARITRGQLEHPPGAVIICSSEDSYRHTIVPRLLVAGADLDLIHFVAIRTDGVEEGLSIPENAGELERTVDTLGAALVVLDPVVGHLSGTIDSHKDHQVRRALGPLAMLADRTGVAVLGIGHLNKSPGGDVLHRLVGSVGFGAAARSVLLFTDDPQQDEDSPERLLIHGKSNLSALAVPLRFKVEQRLAETDDGRQLVTSGLGWLGEAPGATAGSALRPRDDDAERSEKETARDVILGKLEDGARSWAELAKALRVEGVSEITGRRARDELKKSGRIDKEKLGMDGGWTWFLRPELAQSPPKNSEDAPFSRSEQIRPNEQVRGPEADPIEAASSLLAHEFGAVEAAEMDTSSSPRREAHRIRGPRVTNAS